MISRLYNHSFSAVCYFNILASVRAHFSRCSVHNDISRHVTTCSMQCQIKQTAASNRKILNNSKPLNGLKILKDQ